MAYQAKRIKKYTEDFELVDEKGEVKHVLHVELDADDMLPKINRKYAELTQALAETTELKRRAESNEEVDQAYETLGRATVAVYQAVFGDEDTATIVEFYDGRYIEMCREVTPFITQCVIPQCIQIKQENQKAVLQSYNRRPRRNIFKKV